MRLSSPSLLALGTLLALAGCSTPPPPEAVHASLVSQYVLDSGDELRVVVFGQTDLTSNYTVDKAGNITMPLIGAVPARGHTTRDIERDVGEHLKKGFVRNPDVSVEVSRYRPVFIMGEVNNGGQYSYVPGLTVQQAIAIAGGFSPRAQRSYVDIMRQQNGQVFNLPAVLSDPVYPGDTIEVRQRLF